MNLEINIEKIGKSLECSWQVAGASKVGWKALASEIEGLTTLMTYLTTSQERRTNPEYLEIKEDLMMLWEIAMTRLATAPHL